MIGIIVLNDMERDALKEVANVGAGNASTALSNILKMKVDLVVSSLDFVSFEHVEKLISGPQKMVLGIYTPIVEGMNGTVVVMFNFNDVIGLMNILRQKNNETLTPEDHETLKNIGNALTGSYIDSLNQFLDMKMAFSQTNIILTFGESIVDILLSNIDPEAKGVLFIKTRFGIESTNIEGEFMMLLAVTAVESLLATIKKSA